MPELRSSVAARRTMNIYRSSPDPEPDSHFEPGQLRHLVPGNRGRLLDPRRTPVWITGLDLERGYFLVEIADFEDRGAVWEVELENIGHYQFARTGALASESAQEACRRAIARFDRPYRIPCSAKARQESDRMFTEARKEASAWLASHSSFLAAGAPLPDVATRTGSPLLQADLKRYLGPLWELEDAFCRSFVSNPYAGEMVKAHRIVLAEMGRVAYEGKVIRGGDPFAGPFSRDARRRHILMRMAFVQEALARTGRTSLLLYRGVASDGRLLRPSNRTFVSATFSRDVALSHFDSLAGIGTQVLYRQEVPLCRLFMSYLETVQMNRPFQEAEAVLLYDPANLAF